MLYWLVFILYGAFLPFISSHGRLVKPPGRSTAWRYGFKTPTNYNDHELFCGGFSKQWQTNKGKCGLCGDDWGQPRPRSNEHGGHYGKGVIVGEYQDSGIIAITVELTANHRGFFEFRLCPHNNLKNHIPEDPRCFDKYLLSSSDGHQRYAVLSNINQFQLSYHLPKGLTCSQCVLQWRYVAGNNWNQCGNGTGKVGCGPQEEFRSCADIRITDNTGHYNTAPETKQYIPTITPTKDGSSLDPQNDQDSGESVDDSVENIDDSEIFLEPINHSKSGQIIPIVAAVLVSLLFLLVLLVIYLRDRRLFVVRRLKLKDTWWPGLLRPHSLNSFKSNTAPPIPPPRMRRNNTTVTNHVKPPIINISNPTGVTINGLPVLSVIPKV